MGLRSQATSNAASESITHFQKIVYPFLHKVLKKLKFPLTNTPVNFCHPAWRCQEPDKTGQLSVTRKNSFSSEKTRLPIIEHIFISPLKSDL